MRKALDPPGEARDDIEILSDDLASRLGHDWHYDGARRSGTSCARSPMHAGMTYARLEELGGIQWPCYDEDIAEPTYLHGRLWADDPAGGGRPAPFSREHEPPVDELDEEFPLRLTTGRRLDSYNTGVQTSGYASPLRAARRSTCRPRTRAAGRRGRRGCGVLARG